MGRDKAWLTVDGEPLIVRALNTVKRAGAKEVFISARVEADYSMFRERVLVDFQPGCGPLSGIERALNASASPLVVILAVDLPHMTAEFLQRLIASCNEGIGIVPELNGKLEPLAAIYPKRCHAIAAELIAQGRYAARDFAETCLGEGAVRSVAVDGSDLGCFSNWNSPADISESPPASQP
jgi:molybdopterin-guanine dinucleotide biosynthesis protein A